MSEKNDTYNKANDDLDTRPGAHNELFAPVNEEDQEPAKEDKPKPKKKKKAKTNSRVVDEFMKKPKTGTSEFDKKVVGIYFNPNVRKALDAGNKKFGTGFKSNFAQEALEIHLEKNFPGILENPDVLDEY